MFDIIYILIDFIGWKFQEVCRGRRRTFHVQ